MSDRLPCFKVYDVRGIVPDELNPEIAERIGRALAEFTRGNLAVIGYDARLSSPEISQSLSKGLRDSGVDVANIGMCGTEMVYFATAKYDYDIGVMVTASHNPPEYNGMKFVREDSRPISGDSGLFEVERIARERHFERDGNGVEIDRNVYKQFTERLLEIVSPKSLRPLRVLENPGNGTAGLAVQHIANHVPLDIEQIDFEPDGNFPHGVPNPILEESRMRTVEHMRGESFDFGVAWDGDYDRCFFFDEAGNFIEGYYLVGLLAQDTLLYKPGATIIYDARLIWNTLDILQRYGGRGVVCKAGHAFIKEKMRAENAEYGGEMSAHHYFKSHWYCDSGMIPFLQIARLVSESGRSLGDLVREMQDRFPCSGEINSKVADVGQVLAQVEAAYADGKIDRIDGLSIEFSDWRFNLRGSNTEPVIRLNVESRGDKALVEEKTEELLALIRA